MPPDTKLNFRSLDDSMLHLLQGCSDRAHRHAAVAEIQRRAEKRVRLAGLCRRVASMLRAAGVHSIV